MVDDAASPPVDRPIVRQSLLVAFASSALVAVIVYVAASGLPSGDAALLSPGDFGPAASVIHEDFPDARLSDGVGHDGQQFYAIARAPMHLDEVSDSLDRPRYRLQRPLYSWASWLLHPSGGGAGLVLAMFAVGIAGIFLLASTAALLSMRLGGGIWPAFIVPLLPGVFVSLRISVADNLALGLALLAVLLAMRGHEKRGALAAVLAVLTKEAMLAILVGQALVRRRRPEVVAALSGLGVAAAWWVSLRLLVDVASEQVIEFTLPFKGYLDSAAAWVNGEEIVAAANAAVVLTLGAWALLRGGRSHPLFGALLGLFSMSVVLDENVVGLNYNGPRTLLPLLVVALLVLTTARAASAQRPIRRMVRFPPVSSDPVARGR